MTFPLVIIALLVGVGTIVFIRKHTVFVPATDFRHEISIVVPSEAYVGEWIPLRASRRIGPWRRTIARRSVNTTDVIPPAFQEQVAANVRWMVSPERIAEFDVAGITKSDDADPWSRSVRFSRPGAFQIRALSRYITDAESLPATITVHVR